MTSDLLPTVTLAPATAVNLDDTGVFLRNRLAPTRYRGGDEELVVDSRATQTPAQVVENKLAHTLRGAALSVSMVRLAKTARGR